MEELILFLSTIYPDMSKDLKEYLLKTIKFRKVKKREIILSPPKINSEIMFIKKGLLRAYYVKDDGEEVSTWFLKELDVIVSIVSFYDQIPTIEYIQALEDSEVFYITYTELEYIYNTFIEFNYIGRVLETKYLKLWNQMLIALRRNSAKERYQWLIDNHPEIIQRVPQKHIASWLDVNEYALSHLKSALSGRQSNHTNV